MDSAMHAQFCEVFGSPNEFGTFALLAIIDQWDMVYIAWKITSKVFTDLQYAVSATKRGYYLVILANTNAFCVMTGQEYKKFRDEYEICCHVFPAVSKNVILLDPSKGKQQNHIGSVVVCDQLSVFHPSREQIMAIAFPGYDPCDPHYLYKCWLRHNPPIAKIQAGVYFDICAECTNHKIIEIGYFGRLVNDVYPTVRSNKIGKYTYYELD